VVKSQGERGVHLSGHLRGTADAEADVVAVGGLSNHVERERPGVGVDGLAVGEDLDLRHLIDSLEARGIDCSPEGHERKHCECGYSGVPADVIRYGEIDEAECDGTLFVCAGCGDA